jgi:hypothetical protein
MTKPVMTPAAKVSTPAMMKAVFRFIGSLTQYT